MRINIKNTIAPSIPLAGLLFGACIFIWFTSYWGECPVLLSSRNSYLVEFFYHFTSPNSLMSNLISLVFAIINAVLITQFNSQFAIIRSRTILPTLFFLILMSCWNETHLANGSQFALTLLLISCFYFFSIYRDPKAVEQAFMSSFFIAIGSLIVPALVVIIPISWIGLIMFHSISLRTFLASLIGAFIPAIFYFSAAYYFHPDFSIIDFYYTYVGLEFAIPAISIPMLIYIVSLLVILAICVVGMTTTYNNDSIHARTKLKYIFLLLSACSFVAFFCMGQLKTMLPTIACWYGLLASHSFTLKKGNFWGILFLIFCGVNLVYLLSKYL